MVGGAFTDEAPAAPDEIYVKGRETNFQPTGTPGLTVPAQTFIPAQRPSSNDATTEAVPRTNSVHAQNLPAAPAAPADYSDLPEALKGGDQAVLHELLDYAGERGVAKAAIYQAGPVYREWALTRLSTIDAAASERATSELREAWGHSYDANIGISKRYLDNLPGNLGRLLRDARTEDGTRLGDSKTFAEFIAEVAKRSSTSRAGGRSDDRVSMENEKAAIKKMMGTDAYTKNEAIQARYRDLISAGQPQEEQPGQLSDAQAQQLRDIENLMRTDPKTYYANEKIQSVYRRLLSARG